MSTTKASTPASTTVRVSTNNGSLESTLLNFHTQGQHSVHLDLILVGYTGFTESQLFV